MLLAIQGVMGVFRSLARSASPHYPVALHSPAAAATFSPEPIAGRCDLWLPGFWSSRVSKSRA